MSKKEGRWKNPKPKTETLTPTPERKMGKREKDKRKRRRPQRLSSHSPKHTSLAVRALWRSTRGTGHARYLNPDPKCDQMRDHSTLFYAQQSNKSSRHEQQVVLVAPDARTDAETVCAMFNHVTANLARTSGLTGG